MDFADIPGRGAATVEGHAGRLLWAELAGVETLIFQGRRHWYEGAGWEPIAIPIRVLKRLGASIVVITNAAGGIRRDLQPGDMMVIDDHINAMGDNPLAGVRAPFWNVRFPDMTRVYDPGLHAMCDDAARAMGLKLAHGVYLSVPGPSLETPAEIAAFRRLGADAVGMSTVPEAILARAAGLRVVGLSCISNFAAGVGDGAISHEKVMETVRSALPRLRSLIEALWHRIAAEAGPAPRRRPVPRERK
jgi:purine-nucleoside phosphorylase